MFLQSSKFRKLFSCQLKSFLIAVDLNCVCDIFPPLLQCLLCMFVRTLATVSITLLFIYVDLIIIVFVSVNFGLLSIVVKFSNEETE